MERLELERLEERAKFIRKETVRLITIAGSGHYSSVFSAADILSVLYYHSMKITDDPNWPARDRMIMSKGHVAVGVFPILADLGYFPKEWLDTYAHLGSVLGDHPDVKKVPGVDFSSGSLGHGLSVGLGMGLHMKKHHPDKRVFVLLGDGEMNEGQIWEAAQAAAYYKVNNLVGILDRNKMQLDGPTKDVMSTEPLADKWRAFGWQVQVIDGHDIVQLAEAFDKVREPSDAPHMIIADTVKGKGVNFMEADRVWHLGCLYGQDVEDVMNELG